ncbi:MAG: hypothetical protein ACXADO_03065 [Candidatus Thorarchaeota archaeon]|jgi:hypothetical protein
MSVQHIPVLHSYFFFFAAVFGSVAFFFFFVVGFFFAIRLSPDIRLKRDDNVTIDPGRNSG